MLPRHPLVLLVPVELPQIRRLAEHEAPVVVGCRVDEVPKHLARAPFRGGRPLRRAGLVYARKKLQAFVNRRVKPGRDVRRCHTSPQAANSDVHCGQRFARIEIVVAQKGHSFVVTDGAASGSCIALLMRLTCLINTKTAAATMKKPIVSLMNWPHAITGMPLAFASASDAGMP